MQMLQVRLRYRELEVHALFKKNGESDKGCGKICVRTKDEKKDAFLRLAWDCREYIKFSTITCKF